MTGIRKERAFGVALWCLDGKHGDGVIDWAIGIGAHLENTIFVGQTSVHGKVASSCAKFEVRWLAILIGLVGTGCDFLNEFFNVMLINVTMTFTVYFAQNWATMGVRTKEHDLVWGWRPVCLPMA